MTRTALINNNQIELEFDFDTLIINKIKYITGRRWVPSRKVWTVPLTPWHCSQVIEVTKPFRFYIDPKIKAMQDSEAKPPKLEFPHGLYPFQEETVSFMAMRNGRCIVADEMGLGKTISALTYVHMFGGKTLVIAPANVIYKWKAECEKWLQGRTAEVIENGKTEIPSTDVHIMSYGIMTRRYDELKAKPYDVIIFDECHYIKDSRSKRTKVAKALIHSGIPKVIGLSGTPFMNRPGELFPMLNAIDPVGFRSFYDFASRYMGAQYIMGFWRFPTGVVTNADELATRMKSYMIRHTKREVLKQLPDLTRTIVPVEIDNRTQYNEAVRDIRKWLKSKDKNVSNPAHVLTRLNVLRQIVGEGKVEAAIELAESVLQDGKKVVLFAHHKDIITKLSDRLRMHGVRAIVGDTPPKERQENSNLFLMEDSSINVMLISTAGNVGIDLYSASDIIFVEREWVPAQEEQAEARLHRIGQKNAVSAYYLTAQRTVDEKLANLVQKKRDMFGKVVRQDEILETILEDF